MRSRVTPAVSGYSSKTTKNWTTIITAKNANGAAPEDAATTGNMPEIIAFMIQWVKLPRLWPCARTRFGKTSLR